MGRRKITTFTLIAATILLAMGAHAVIPHQHPAFAFGTGISAEMHGEDRRHWLLALLASWASALLAVTLGSRAAVFSFLEIAAADRDATAGLSPWWRRFAKGIVHPKLCG